MGGQREATKPGGVGDARADEELARLAQADPGQFALLYERYANEIERYLQARLGDRGDAAQDLASQVFARALAALPRYTEGSFRGWLYQIARNGLIDHLRRQRPAAALDGEIATGEPSLEERVIAEEARAQLHAALDDLTEPQRTIIALRLHGHTGPEIAARLGMGPEAVKSAQYRAMAKLRVALRHLDERDDA